MSWPSNAAVTIARILRAAISAPNAGSISGSISGSGTGRGPRVARSGMRPPSSASCAASNTSSSAAPTASAARSCGVRVRRPGCGSSCRDTSAGPIGTGPPGSGAPSSVTANPSTPAPARSGTRRAAVRQTVIRLGAPITLHLPLRVPSRLSAHTGSRTLKKSECAASCSFC